MCIEHLNYGGDKLWQVEINPVKQLNPLALMYKLALEEEIPVVKLISREEIPILQQINLIKLGGKNNKMAPGSNKEIRCLQFTFFATTIIALYL